MIKRLLLVILLGITIFTISAIGIVFLDRIGYICPSRYFLHIYCAGCGVTRMLKSLIKGDFLKAFSYNQVFFVLFFVGIVYLLYAIIKYIKDGKIIIPSNKVLIFIAILLSTYMVLRNIPYFDFLRPIS